MNNKVKKLTYAGLLTGLAIMIPLYFGFLKIVIGPFSATLASHVPIFLSMFFGPATAVVVGVGSTLGFFVAGTPLWIVSRAAMHIFVGLIGASMLKKGISFRKVVFITAPIHGILEAIAVLPFRDAFGWSINFILVSVLIGTILHHLVDGIISASLVRILNKSGRSEFAPKTSLE